MREWKAQQRKWKEKLYFSKLFSHLSHDVVDGRIVDGDVDEDDADDGNVEDGYEDCSPHMVHASSTGHTHFHLMILKFVWITNWSLCFQIDMF